MVSHIAIKICIISFKPNRVCAQPSSNRGIIPAVDVILELSVRVEYLSSITEQNGIVNCLTGGIFAEKDVTVSIVKDVGGNGNAGGRLLDNVADGAEVVGEGPEDTRCCGVGEEFVLMLWCPEVVVRDGRAGGVGEVGGVKLDGGLVVLGDEDGFGVGSGVTVGVEGFANPDVVVIVGVFDGLGGRPRGGGYVVSLLCDFGEAVAVVPFVQLAVGGIGFGNAITFVVVRVSPVGIRG